MTLEEIKALMPEYNKWILNMAFWYGEDYAKEYCTWERFRIHWQILTEVRSKRK
jgi:hypothetical protein